MDQRVRVAVIIFCCWMPFSPASVFPAAEETGKAPVVDSLQIRDMDIHDVLNLLSKKTGMNIIAGKGISGKISIYLDEIELDDVLRIILDSNDLAYFRDGGVIRVVTAAEYDRRFGYQFAEQVKSATVRLQHLPPQDAVSVLDKIKGPSGKIIYDNKMNLLILMDHPERLKMMRDILTQLDAPLTTEVFELSYADAGELVKMLETIRSGQFGSLTHDGRSNKIIVTDTAAKISEMKGVIEAFDVKEREVLIEAKIVQVTLSDQHKLGINWEAVVRDYHGLTLTNKFDILNSNEKVGKLSIGTLAEDDYTFLIEALETVGDTNILSSPSITSLNNEEAKILVGSTEPYVTTTTTTPASGPTVTAETVNFIDVGVKLYVTPTIHKDDFITLRVKPEVSSVVKTLTTGNNNVIPVVETSEAEAVVRIKDSVTLVIGGLIKEEQIDKVNKIPLLGDVPLLGLAFRNSDRLTRKTEIVIFLTPRIITGDVPAGYKKHAQIPNP